jgi:hypothetical protein
MKKLIAILITAFVISCNPSKEKEKCIFFIRATDLLKENSNKMYVTHKENGEILEIRDKGIDSTKIGGSYSFDKSGRLTLYLFNSSDTSYSYSEEYDSLGNLIKSVGDPLVDFRWGKKGTDSLSFIFFFFALNKKYQNLQIFSNQKDTINPVLMYRSNFYTNMKCTRFRLPILSGQRHLIIYINGLFSDTCTHIQKSFSDTLNFRNM